MTLRDELARTTVELTDLSPLQRWFLEALAEDRRERDQRVIDATDADRECPHGKLPGDRVQTCDCWRAA